MPRIAALLAPLLALSLANCADDQPPVAANAPPGPPGIWPDRVDGNYKGTETLAATTQPPVPDCPDDTFGKIEIGDRKLYFAYRPDTLFVAPIQPDGTIFAKAGPSILEGTLLGDRLAFTVRTPVCASSFDLTWKL